MNYRRSGEVADTELACTFAPRCSQIFAHRLLLLGSFALVTGCGTNTQIETADTTGVAKTQADIEAFCSRCHKMPDPAYFPKGRWADEVYRGYRFHEESLAREQASPPTQAAIAYFLDRAPRQLPPPRAVEFVGESSPRFRQRSSNAIPKVKGPAVAHLSWRRWTAERAHALVIADMREGLVAASDGADHSWELLAKVPHPAHVEWVDLDSDTRMDAVVADLGSYEPADHSRGSVVWLRQDDRGRLQPKVIASDLGRVSETRAADFNADGRVDLVVAEFGWQRTGRVLLLEQLHSHKGNIEFRSRKLDERHGAIRVPPFDLDFDGDTDFVAQFGQEHESIVAFLNDGRGRFVVRPLGDAADPAYGSSGVTPCDLDGDGDMDLLASNGDMFDSYMIKPYHGIRWLENQGELKFIEHRLLDLPGVHGASAADIDLDGDLDIVTAACYSLGAFSSLSILEQQQTSSAVWLEQTLPGTFVCHELERGNPFHAVHLLADIDEDGDTDVLLGSFAPASLGPSRPFLIFENLTVSSD